MVATSSRPYTDIGTAGRGVTLDFTLATAGQQYSINIWTAGFATQTATVVGSLTGATSYNSGGLGGSGDSGFYGDYNNPKEQYLYTFLVTADNANDVFNFSIVSGGTQGASSHVLITAASIAAVPEPSTFALLLGGIGALFFIRRCHQS